MAAKSTKAVLSGERSEYEGALVLTNGLTVNVELTEELEIEYDEDNMPDSFSGNRIKISLFDNVSGVKLRAASPEAVGNDIYFNVNVAINDNDDGGNAG